jgi:putative phosphoribosyl transferase
MDDNVIEMPELRDIVHVFRDREHAGLVLSQMLISYRETDAVVFGIPAGGVPVAAPIVRKLGLNLDVAVVSKITLPWTTEAGYGAVAFEGTVQLNQEMVSQVGLTQDEIDQGIEKASSKVKRRLKEFRGDKPFPDLAQRPAILVDDGIASGFTMLVAVKALKNKDADKIIIAVPTAHLQALERVSSEVDEVYCANIRGGWGFAVADAYQNWYDVSDEEVNATLEEFY